MRPPGTPFFLGEDFIRAACEAPGLKTETVARLITAARRVAHDETLRALAWYQHHRLFVAGAPSSEVRQWPVPDALGDDVGLFNALVLLSGTPHMQQVHRQHGVPDDVVRATVADLNLCIETEDYAEDHGIPGISPRILRWLLNHWRGDLYRLGRLQFVPARFGGRLRAFRHRRTGVVVALSEPGIRYRADGQLDGAGGVEDPEGAWVSALTLTEREAVGHPISPLGCALRETIALPADDWKLVLSPGDPTLDMHIAAGEPMDFDACGDSIRRALEFFPRHFPERPFVALTCFSWLLDAQFEHLLPRTSNLVRFQKEVYLFPIPFNGESTVATVFGRRMVAAWRGRDFAALPRATTMQRAFAAHLERGGHFRGGGCFLLPEDFRWGEQVYRVSSPPVRPADRAGE